tara:strand:- start:144 stop:542 length:399 start_codon:yes stop_codon:yes gene_type:complete
MAITRERVREILKRDINLNFRISRKLIDKSEVKKQAFITMLSKMREIEDRKDFLVEEIGIDVTAYEDKFFQVIESLLKLTFNTNQLEMIQLYLYQLLPDKEWDGTILVRRNKKEEKVKFRTSEEVWNVIKNM